MVAAEAIIVAIKARRKNWRTCQNGVVFHFSDVLPCSLFCTPSLQVISLYAALIFNLEQPYRYQISADRSDTIDS